MQVLGFRVHTTASPTARALARQDLSVADATPPLERGGTGVPVLALRDEGSFIWAETIVPCYRGQAVRNFKEEQLL